MSSISIFCDNPHDTWGDRKHTGSVRSVHATVPCLCSGNEVRVNRTAFVWSLVTPKRRPERDQAQAASNQVRVAMVRSEICDFDTTRCDTSDRAEAERFASENPRPKPSSVARLLFVSFPNPPPVICLLVRNVRAGRISTLNPVQSSTIQRCD